MSTRNNAAVVETVSIKKGEYKAILGLAGAGFIGNTSVMFSVRIKGFPKVAHVKSSHIPPMTLISNGEPIQSFRIHVDEEDKLLFVITESLIPAEGCWPIAEALLKWLKEKNTKEIYAIDGLPFSAISSDVKALVYANKMDPGRFEYPLLREGAVSGINSCVLEDCVENKFPYACLFIPTTKLTSIDYTGSANAVEVMNKLFKLGVDHSPLRGTDEAKKTEQRQTGLGRLFKKS
jgi:predicted ATP-grasp superfamily ATP-dependent carboligase